VGDGKTLDGVEGGALQGGDGATPPVALDRAGEEGGPPARSWTGCRAA